MDMDFSKLLGFDSVADQLGDGVDFQDVTVGAKLGAKVGGEVQGLAGVVDFRDETFAARLGAKVGEEPAEPLR